MVFTLVIFGKKGGKAKSLSNKSLIISSNSTARIQEDHNFNKKL